MQPLKRELMKNLKLANRYAKALFEFANKQNQIETVNQDLGLVKTTLRENRELQVILNSPVIEPSKKHAIFTALFQGHLSETTFTFIDVIIRKKREPALRNICEEFTKYYNDYHNIRVVTVTTAQPMSAELREKIKGLLSEETHYTIDLEEIIRPDIIGGIIVKMGDFYFDAGILSKINKLRNAFAYNEYQINY